jgi:superfamily II DNA/RNA helicase
LFARQLSLYSTVCVGGENIGAQIRQLRRKNHFIIGTPGRVIDLIKRNIIALNTIHTVVLDEADRMLDMGFIADIRFIMGKIPQDRHTLLFSATMSPRIQAMVSDFLRDPVTVSVKTHETPNSIHQDVVSCKNLNKIEVLSNFLANSEFKKVLVFGRTKHGVERLCKELSRRGVKVDSIHSNKTHGQRQYALRNFKENRVQALIATDIAARGLDIEGITHVINYEMPATYEDYVHRIGRTGRGIHKGKALTFVD